MVSEKGQMVKGCNTTKTTVTSSSEGDEQRTLDRSPFPLPPSP